MIFHFRMLCDEDDYFLREYEVPYDMTLSDFREFIDRDVHYRSDSVTSFFTADSPRVMSDTLLSQILHNTRDRLIYCFDLCGDRAFYLELIGAKKTEAGVEYPRTVAAQSDAPDQDHPEDAESHSMFDEAMDEFSDFNGNDTYNDYDD